MAVPIIIGLAILGVLVVAVPLGLWLYLRKRQGDASSKPGQSRAETLVFACSHCGKKIKTNPERAGKTVKCPQCGKAVKVPTTPPDDAEEVS